MSSYGEGMVMKIFRLERYFFVHDHFVISKFIYYLIQVVFNCVIPGSVVIGDGSAIAHGVGIVIHQDTVIGKNTTIYQNVTIGNPGVCIGDNCLIGAGAVILGPCTIGDNVKIGANAVVTKDIPCGCTIIGPKSIIKNPK